MPALRDLSAALAAVVVARADYYAAAEAHATAATAASAARTDFAYETANLAYDAAYDAAENAASRLRALCDEIAAWQAA